MTNVSHRRPVAGHVLLTFLVLACAAFFSSVAAAPRASVRTHASAQPSTNAPSGVYYEIFVRSFYDSDGDGIGDLNGITEKMDYLKSLGVSGLWLTPINPSPSYHGYDVSDYYAVNPQFGTLADLRRLVKSAHAHGIKVVLDLVLNHTSDQNPWFVKALDPHSPYHDWYTWASAHTDLKAISSNHTPAWHARGNQHYLGVFPGGMPDLNYDNPAVQREMIKVGRFWLRQGVDGFRLDAARYIHIDMKSDLGNPRALARNLAWWKQFRTAMRNTDPNVLLIGELWIHRESHLAPYYTAFDSVFNYPLLWTLTDSAKNERSVDLGSYLHRALAMFDKYAGGHAVDAPFLSNHDQVRAMSRFHGNTAHMRMAAAMLLTLPGRPFIYYGEEIGMFGDKPDPRLRQPMRWMRDPHAAGAARWETVSAANASPDISVQAEQGNPHSLLNFYRLLIHWRRALPALRDGGMNTYPADGGPISAYVRTDAAQGLLVIHNLSGRPRTVKLRAGRFDKVIRRTNSGIHLDARTLFMPAYSTAILN